VITQFVNGQKVRVKYIRFPAFIDNPGITKFEKKEALNKFHFYKTFLGQKGIVTEVKGHSVSVEVDGYRLSMYTEELAAVRN
jgi:hypothetical protein